MCASIKLWISFGGRLVVVGGACARDAGTVDASAVMAIAVRRVGFDMDDLFPVFTGHLPQGSCHAQDDITPGHTALRDFGLAYRRFGSDHDLAFWAFMSAFTSYGHCRAFGYLMQDSFALSTQAPPHKAPQKIRPRLGG